MATEAYYFALNGVRFGPVSREQLTELVRIGKLGPQDYVWKEGMAEWAPAATMPGLFAPPVPRPAAPAPAPVAVSAGPPRPKIDLPQLGREARTRVQRVLEPWGRERGLDFPTTLALVAGLGALVIVLLATCLPWMRLGTKTVFFAAEFGETSLGLSLWEGKLAFVLVLASGGFVGAGFFLQRYLPAGILAAGAAATCTVLLTLAVQLRVSRTLSEMNKVQEMLPMLKDAISYRGGVGFGLYLALLAALAASAAFLFAGLRRPLEWPVLAQAGGGPFMQRYGALLGAQAIAVLLGLVVLVLWF